MWCSNQDVAHTHRCTRQMLSYTCWHLSHGRPARREAAHTLCTEEKRQIKAERKKAKIWGRERKRKDEWEKRYWENYSTYFKRENIFWMYAGWVSGYTCPLIPASAGLLVSPSCLAAHSSLPAEASELPSGRCTHPPYVFYTVRALTRLGIGAL